MPCSEHCCPAGTCRNPVEDPFTPCGDCLAAFGPYLRPARHPASETERGAVLDRAAAKAATPAPRPVRFHVDEMLAEEVAHFSGYGWSAEEVAARLGVTKAAVTCALEQAREAA